MNIIKKLMAKSRIRRARKHLSSSPSPISYTSLAQEYARMGMAQKAVDVCNEGLRLFPSNTLLSRLADRAKHVAREERMTELRRQLSEAPRPALWAEMCELLLELGQIARAGQMAQEWIESKSCPEGLFMLARVRTERFLEDRGRGLGFAAMESLDQAIEALGSDGRALELKMMLQTKIGAWSDAQESAVKLLDLDPGDPELEARFRRLQSISADSPTLERALLEVEKTGRFADEHVDSEKAAPAQVVGNVRPILRKLAEDKDVHAAMYVRGSTVLIQGPKGATADRTARTVRSIISSGSATARRLGLGQIFQIQVEGDFGQLAIAPGELDAGVIWSAGGLGRRREEVLLGLAGLQVSTEKVKK